MESNHLLDIISTENNEIQLRGFSQWLTYENLYCGLPTAEINHTIMGYLKEKATELFRVEAFYLLEPKQTPIEYEGVYKLGEPMRLPEVCCIAKFYYGYKALNVAWYQDDFSFPPSPEIMAKIKSIPWEEVAGEGDWG